MRAEAARVLDKTLKGANASDLPVERPTRLTLVIKLETAKALDLIPPSRLLQADQGSRVVCARQRWEMLNGSPFSDDGLGTRGTRRTLGVQG
jgi:hypothetical protein